LPAGVARLAWRDAWDSGPAMEQLRFAGRKLVEWRDFPALWRREEFDRAGAVDQLLTDVAELEAMAAKCRRANDNLVISLRPLQQLLTWLGRGDGVRRKDSNALESLLLETASRFET